MAERLGMVIDMKGCVACASCAVACKVENNLPDGVWWNRILTDGGDNPDTPAGAYPNLTMENIAVACQHCENPACVKVCPVGATYKDPETGAVRQDYDKCIGCRMCMSACPYTGVRSFNWEEPKHAIGHAMGDADVATHQKHVVEKCTLCKERTDGDEVPLCVRVCPARARIFGDLDDPDSEISRAALRSGAHHLLEEKGSRPQIFYIG